ncbi:MAG: FAD-dependent monooxygenase [Alcanivoracaceae bacterium]|nr:FAD-dependent monooxygenase [Alcanivoracaceae bacterium]
MAGGMLAASLAEQSLQIVLLDAAPAPQYPQGESALRVSALTETSESLLQRAQVWPLMPVARMQPYEQMEVRDGDGTGEVHFSAADANASHLGTLVENDAVVAALYQRCLSLTRVQWRNDCRVSAIARADDGWRIALSDGEVLKTRLLVGADGARSMVRSAAGLQAQSRDTGHVAIVATLTTELPHQRCARQAFLDSGPVALLPLYGDGHSCSLVWSLWPERAQQLMQLPGDGFARELTKATQSWLGEISLASERLAFPIHDLHAGNYVADGVALIGDAAHVVHPLAGQGINLGLLDAAVLAEEICRALAAGRQWHSLPLLQRYQRRRRGHNAMVVSAMRGFKVLFEQRSPVLRFVRNAGMSMVDRHHIFKGLLARQALGRFDDAPLG